MIAVGQKGRFRALDAWRGIAAIFVVLFHIPIRESFLRLPFFGGTGNFVDFFFVLSGFVIAHAYGSQLTETPSETPMFLIRRIGRLWPLHIFMFVLFLSPSLIHLALFHWYAGHVQTPASAWQTLLTVLGQITLLQTLFGPSSNLMVNGVAWTISTEFWTYVVFAVIALAAARQQIVTKIAIVLASVFVLWHFAPDRMASDNQFGFFRCFYGFFAGQLVYQCFASSASLNFQSRWTAVATTVLEAAIIIAVIGFDSAKNTKLAFAAPILFSALVYIFAAERGLFSRLLLSNGFQKLGLYSYSIYMLHSLFIIVVLGILRVAEKLLHVHLVKKGFFPGTERVGYFINFGSGWLMVCFALLIVGLVVYAASWTWCLIERPGQKYFGRIADRYGKAQLQELPASTFQP